MDSTLLIGLIGVLLTIFGWGVGDYLSQRIVRRIGPLSAFSLLALILSLMLLPLSLSEGFIPAISADVLPYLIGLVVFELLAGILLYKAYKNGKLSVVDPLVAFSVCVSAILGVVVLGEQLSFAAVGLVSISFVGAVLIGVSNWSKLRAKDFLAPGALFALASAVVYGASDLSAKVGIDAIGPATALFIGMLGASLVSFTLAIYYEKQNPLTKINKLVLVAGVIEGLGWIGYAYALDNFPVGLAAAMVNSYPVVAMVCAYRFAHERVTNVQLFGAFLLVSASIGLTYLVSAA